jgi:hypothetical protein
VARDPIEHAFAAGDFREQHHAAEKQVHVRTFGNGPADLRERDESRHRKQHRAADGPHPFGDAARSREDADDARCADDPDGDMLWNGRPFSGEDEHFQIVLPRP